jgi:hypothetical protein
MEDQELDWKEVATSIGLVLLLIGAILGGLWYAGDVK